MGSFSFAPYHLPSSVSWTCKFRNTYSLNYRLYLKHSNYIISHLLYSYIETALSMTDAERERLRLSWRLRLGDPDELDEEERELEDPELDPEELDPLEEPELEPELLLEVELDL